MKTEFELRNKCTPEVIKWVFVLSNDGVQISDKSDPMIILENDIFFPLLIHRAVEGWNKNCENHIVIFSDMICLTRNWVPNSIYKISDYQPTTLTHSECACLDCLICIFEEERK